MNIWDRPKQTFLTENGQVGDCWRCCVAAVLQVPAESVPHFVRDSESCMADTQLWLNDRGFLLVAGGRGVTLGFHRWHGVKGEPAHHPVISCGISPRTAKPGQHHAVVKVNDVMVYDPHPSNGGLVWVVEEFIIVPRFGRVPFIP